MELILFVLMVGGQILLWAALTFITATITGLGLGVGLYTIKKWFQRRELKKVPSAEQRAESFLEEEAIAAGGGVTS